MVIFQEMTWSMFQFLEDLCFCLMFLKLYNQAEQTCGLFIFSL